MDDLDNDSDVNVMDSEEDDSDDVNIVSDSDSNYDSTTDLIQSDSNDDSDVNVIAEEPGRDSSDEVVVVYDDAEDGDENYDRTMATLGLQRVQQRSSDDEEGQEVCITLPPSRLDLSSKLCLMDVSLDSKRTCNDSLCGS
jgi:hypothetical protein